MSDFNIRSCPTLIISMGTVDVRVGVLAPLNGKEDNAVMHDSPCVIKGQHDLFCQFCRGCSLGFSVLNMGGRRGGGGGGGKFDSLRRW